jgi:hypothetical protein
MFQRCHTDAPAMPHQTTEVRRDARPVAVDSQAVEGNEERIVPDIGEAHLGTTTRPRYLALAVFVGALVASLLAVSTAAASDVTVSECSQLQHVLNNAESGDVITLAALCTKSNSGEAEGSFKLPSNKVTDLTIEGESGMTAGFEGTGVEGSALEGTGNGLVLRNLVVEKYSLNEKSAVTLHPSEGALPKLESDRFIEDVQTDTSGYVARGGALYLFTYNSTCAYTSPLSITNSVFQGDQIIDTSTNHPSDQGGAAYAEIVCSSASGPVDFATLTANRFTGDGIDTTGGREALGGGLFLGNSSQAEILVSATQSGNVFEADTIASSTPTGLYGGGGEWAPSLDLTSTDDSFVKNSLPGPQGAGASSEGAGLGVITSTCSEKATASATLDNAVVAANAIGAPSEGGESEGAGIYAGCFPTHPNGHFHLTLNDSTVVDNQAPGGISGIDGEESDQLALFNSIVTSPSLGEADVGGFRTPSGSLTSLFSDACAPGTSTPLPGEGNICANPLLADNGDPTSGDVHQTPSSPTIDAGSNALVPAGLTTDVFGDPRILAGHAGCTQSFPAVVDMGADEFAPGVLSCPPPFRKPSPPRPGRTNFVSLKTSSTGAALRLSCTSAEGQRCTGTIYIVAEETLHGKKVIAVGSARHRRAVTIGQAPFSLPAGGTATFTVKLNASGRALLRRFHAISAYVSANEASPTSTPFIFLLHEARFSEPKQHGRRHPKHPKHH